MLAHCGCPCKFIQIIRLLNDGMTRQVQDRSLRDFKRGEVGLRPRTIIFNLFFACVLRQAALDLEEGVYIRYWYDSSIFDVRRLAARTKTIFSLIREMLFADNRALMAHKVDDLQVILKIGRAHV